MTAYRWSRTIGSPDHVCRTLWHGEAAVMWDNDQTCIRFQLADSLIELYDAPFSALLINGPTEDAVRDTASRLGYRDRNETVVEIKYEVATRRKAVVPR